ncbi:GTPase domain-containing protein [Vibrio coralliilyticus]
MEFIISKPRRTRWFKNIEDACKSASAIISTMGLIVGLSANSFLDAPLAKSLSTVGFLVGILGIAYLVIKAYPPKVLQASECVGMTVSLQDLDYMTPSIEKLAIIGPTRTGKTTLKERLNFRTPENKRTQGISATITAITSNPVKYIAVLDGGGEVLTQQFKIAEQADFLCIVIDHNISNSSLQIDTERQKETSEFMDQVRHHLRNDGIKQKKWIEIIVNKQDLRGKLDEAELADFVEFVGNEKLKWETSSISKDVSSENHSNLNFDDVSRIMDKLVNKTNG